MFVIMLSTFFLDAHYSPLDVKQHTTNQILSLAQHIHGFCLLKRHYENMYYMRSINVRLHH